MITSIAVATSTHCLAQEYFPELGQLEFAGESLVLPLTEQGGHPKVIVDMGDGKEHVFIVDTGASVNVLDSELAMSLGLEVVGEMEIGAPGGPQIPGNIVKAPLAHVGGAAIENAEFVTMDIAKFSGGTTQGILGLGQVDIDVAGTTLATHIDTGSMAGFTLPVEMKASLELKNSGQGVAKAHMVGGDRDVQFGQLDGDILFAGSRYEDPNVGFMDPSPGYGNVGGRVLSDYVVSIDQQNQLIRFRQSAHKPVAAANNAPRRLGVQFRGAPRSREHGGDDVGRRGWTWAKAASHYAAGVGGAQEVVAGRREHRAPSPFRR
jgi:hypothetical protein